MGQSCLHLGDEIPWIFCFSSHLYTFIFILFFNIYRKLRLNSPDNSFGWTIQNCSYSKVPLFISSEHFNYFLQLHNTNFPEVWQLYDKSCGSIKLKQFCKNVFHSSGILYLILCQGLAFCKYSKQFICIYNSKKSIHLYDFGVRQLMANQNDLQLSNTICLLSIFNISNSQFECIFFLTFLLTFVFMYRRMEIHFYVGILGRAVLMEPLVNVAVVALFRFL